MPQKRNPVAIEHARAIGSKALGQAQAILTAVHNTPFGDIVDTEDDLQPLVFSMFRDATRAVKLVSAAMATADFDAARLEACAADGWTTLTELADTLVRDNGVPFKTAHSIAQRLIGAHQREPERRLVDLLEQISRDVVGKPLEYSEAALARVLSARHFVEIRRTFGGPAPEETGRAAAVSRQQLDADESWWTSATDALANAERLLAERSAAL
jgi:argininosuccinate lyase